MHICTYTSVSNYIHTCLYLAVLSFNIFGDDKNDSWITAYKSAFVISKYV